MKKNLEVQTKKILKSDDNYEIVYKVIFNWPVLTDKQYFMEKMNIVLEKSFDKYSKELQDIMNQFLEVQESNE